ncbi:polynucleotide 5'-hydroxyl-kinase NOL9-like [Lineus longissimus]|uniref:polynucleotide 5'-hydroxyl-kinase NOL9-like n=1 Tax=Lineus longissimus TaxID=88925 RepID=UPI002B4ED72B
MGKRRTNKKPKVTEVVVENVTPKRITAYSAFQEKNRIPRSAKLPISAGKKKNKAKLSAKKVKEAVKMESDLKAKVSIPSKSQSPNLYARSFFKILGGKPASKQVESISIVSEKLPGATKKDEVDKQVVGSDGKKGKRQSRGRKNVPVKESPRRFDPSVFEAGKTELDRAVPQTAVTEVGISKVGCDGGDVRKVRRTSSRISPKLKKEDEPKDSELSEAKNATDRKRKASETESRKTSPRSVRTRKKTRKGDGLKIVGHGKVDLEIVPFVRAGNDRIVDETVEDSVLDNTVEDDVTTEMSDDTSAVIKSNQLIPVPDEDQVYVVLDHPQELCLRGKYSVKTLLGSVTLLGYDIKQGSSTVEVFSPENSSHLVIKTMAVTSEQTTIVLESEIKSKKTLEKVREVLKGNSTVIRLEKLECSVCDKVCVVNPFQSLFPKRHTTAKSSDVDVQLSKIGLTVADDNTRRCVIGEEYDQVAKAFSAAIQTEAVAPPVAVLCGGKNVGKSTLGRFLINTALNSCDAVGYLECDVGQTEFTPPGCVAFNIISKPLLGPPFTHQRNAECMYYMGASSPGDNPSFYIDCVKKVFSVYQSMVPKIPLIINTMGWTQGMGIPLLMDTLRIVGPTFIVQLQSSSYYRNYAPLTTEYVLKTPGWKHTDTKNSGHVHHEHFMIQSPTNLATDGHEKYKAADHRDLAILAYFSHVLPPSVSLMNIHSIQPYVLKWSSVAVHVANAVVPQAQIMYALNATIVALCHADTSLMIQGKDERLPKSFSKMPTCDCIGFGVIRAIDPVKKVFYILTPVAKNELHLVNTIIKGAITIPSELLVIPKSSVTRPYVDNPQNILGVKPVARNYLTRRKSPHRVKKA